VPTVTDVSEYRRSRHRLLQFSSDMVIPTLKQMFKSFSKIEVLISGENREPYCMAELIKVPLGLWSRQGGDQGTMYEFGV